MKDAVRSKNPFMLIDLEGAVKQPGKGTFKTLPEWRKEIIAWLKNDLEEEFIAWLYSDIEKEIIAWF
ncbi:hypothetical protein DPMN_082074 [Dreissena polymorpha]|uniref:Uncharacterized protein n=1 Tax=Dreissena polymorpha TaxID=45954 RepID=A0A9D3Y9U9_DREPO|nr:hypothetical protein DPMN_082074 [Dreissena polymorpha]